jgi:hypothetical protein
MTTHQEQEARQATYTGLVAGFNTTEQESTDDA